MKRQIELTCATCGVKFAKEADYILPGIQGIIINSKGEEIRFVDPTEEHHCDACIAKALNVP